MPTTNRLNATAITQETLQGFANRYAVVAKASKSGQFLKVFTNYVDNRLLEMLTQQGNDHPVDTGLMKQSWVVPKRYIQSTSGKTCEVFLENTATVGAQYELKYGKPLYSAGNYTFKGRRGITGRRLRRYMPYVDEKTKFYTKRLYIIRQKVPSYFKDFLFYFLIEPYVLGRVDSREWEVLYNFDFGGYLKR